MKKVDLKKVFGKFRIIEKNALVKGYVLKQENDTVIMVKRTYQEGQIKDIKMSFNVPGANLQDDYEMHICILLAREKTKAIVIYVER